MSSLLNDKDYVASLEKGLLVLNLFNEKNRKITLSETANLLDMTRATARRFLKTLEILGYLDSDSKYYWLTPKILKLSKAYLTSNSFHKIAQYYVKQIALKTEETSYISVKNG
ncbi:TPA: helix-turn-helix domain-containing protein, partial [Acinetobacter baumannii]|nr:helix-turn-helix domain-containing protein [Acinetobacter baumannii]